MIAFSEQVLGNVFVVVALLPEAWTVHRPMMSSSSDADATEVFSESESP
jgi:hypothetical protein